MYKTTRYALPLFFVALKINSGYKVVAQFVIELETSSALQEALSKLRSLVPELNQDFWVVDFSEAEISAIESTFQGDFNYSMHVVLRNLLC